MFYGIVKMKYRKTSNYKCCIAHEIWDIVGEKPFTVRDIPESCGRNLKSLINSGYVVNYTKEKKDRRNVYKISSLFIYHAELEERDETDSGVVVDKYSSVSVSYR